jgi:hypothetical protein
MLTKTKLAAALAAVAIGVTAFASASHARSPYFWDWGYETPIGYATYVVKTRHGPRVCHWFAEYTDWGFYVGNNLVCSRRR